MITYFLIGIKGKGMRALAKYLYYAGEKVEGYDDNINKDDIYFELTSIGVKFYEKLSNEILNHKKVIITPAIKINDLKRKGLNIKFEYYHETISRLTRNTHTICVCGSFGKTTTTSFMAQILNGIKGTDYLIGDGLGYYNQNSTLVLEACEYGRHFLKYQPGDIIITSIGLEHLDCYEDLEDIQNTFCKFLNKCNGNKVIYGDMKNVDYSKFKGQAYVTYGFNTKNDIVIKNFYYQNNSTIIEVENVILELPIILGKHQVLDLVAAVIMANLKGCTIKDIKKLLYQIQLPKNRFVHKTINNVQVVTDFCGHYAGIESNITQLRSMYPDKCLTVVFQPVSYMRMKKTANLVCKSLKKADFVYICDIFPLRESNNVIEKINFSCNDLIAKIPNAQYYNFERLFFNKDKDVVAIFAPISSNAIEQKICS